MYSGVLAIGIKQSRTAGFENNQHFALERLAPFKTLKYALLEMSLSRKALGILASSPMGPILKSYWPARAEDLRRIRKAVILDDIPLPHVDRFSMHSINAKQMLPFSVTQTYRISIGEWRYNRGRSLKKGVRLSFTVDPNFI